MGTEAILWHRACNILTKCDRERSHGWPDALSINQVAELYFPKDEPMQDALLYLLREAISKGELHSIGNARHLIPLKNRTVTIRTALDPDGDATIIGANPSRGEEGALFWEMKIPTITRESYAKWKDRPPIPEDSPLHGWVVIDTDDSASLPEQKTIIPYKKPKRARDDWTEVIIAAIEGYQRENGATGTELQIWLRLCNHQPSGYQYEWDSRKEELRMQGNPALSRDSFKSRFNNFYPGDKPG